MWLKPGASPVNAVSTYIYMTVYVCVDGNSDSKINIRGVCNEKHLSNRWKHVSLSLSLSPPSLFLLFLITCVG